MLMQVKLSRNLDKPVKHLENAVYMMKHEIFQQEEELQVKFSFNVISVFFQEGKATPYSKYFWTCIMETVVSTEVLIFNCSSSLTSRTFLNVVLK